MALMNWNGGKSVKGCVNRACVGGAWSPCSLKKANGRLHPRLLCTFDLQLYGTERSFKRSRRRVFRDAHGHCATPQSPSEAILRDRSSDQSVRCQELRGRMGKAPCCRTLQRSFEFGGVRKPHTSAHEPGRACTPQWCGAWRQWQGTVGEGCFNDTDAVSAGVASPSSPVEISSNQVHLLVEHHCANGLEQLLADTALLGVIVVDVQRHHNEERQPMRLPSKRSS